MNKKSGFTLAEVLVTLMIIGVIAAMTIPSLMQSTAQQEYKAAYKKAVSMLNQAVTLNYALEGMDASDFTKENFYHLLTQRLNVASADSANKSIYAADGMYYKVGTEGNACTIDGGTVEGNICAKVTVDVNGKKGPNRATTSTKSVYDIFTVNIYPQKALPSTEAQAAAIYAK